MCSAGRGGGVMMLRSEGGKGERDLVKVIEYQ